MGIQRSGSAVGGGLARLGLKPLSAGRYLLTLRVIGDREIHKTLAIE